MQESTEAVTATPKKRKRGWNFVNRAGHRSGRLLVIEPVEPYKVTGKWRCRCECGAEVSVLGDSLQNGDSKSCGCLKREKWLARRTKHGACYTRTYKSWADMRARCLNPNNTAFKDYGGRGITVCERWKSFPNFLADMGHSEPQMTIERVDNNGNYEPENCRWASRLEQGANSRKNARFTVHGKSLHLAEIARRFGIQQGTLRPDSSVWMDA